MSALSKQCFPPVVSPTTRILLLGSLPGEASLAAGQYYAHPRNQFWHLVSHVLGRPLADLRYEQRLVTLQAYGVGLWDVIAEANRHGSLDGNIRNQTHNDLITLIETLPQLRAIGFNGGTSSRIGHRLLQGFDHRLCLIDLPSSSPAYTLGFADKLAQWQKLQAVLAENMPAKAD